MKPLYVHSLTAEEREALEAGLKSNNAFTMRRCQILLASANQQRAPAIAQNLHCSQQTVRNAIREFELRGLSCLNAGSHIPHTVIPVLTAEKRERLRIILHQSPRQFHKERSTWTLGLLAQVCQEQGLSETVLSAPTLLDAIQRLGVSWKRAKKWLSSPDPAYLLKKTA